jgi:ABC-2 type transport system permease protein
MNVVALIARREITTRLQQKGFRIGIAATLLIVAIICIVPSFTGGGSGRPTYDVALVHAPSGTAEVLASTGKALHVTVHTHAASAGTARVKVRSGDWDAALVGRRIIARNSSDAVVGIVEQAYRASTVDARLHAAGLSSGQISTALDVAPLPVTTVASSDTSTRKAIATIAIIALFTQLATFCTWVAMGVVEEKSSRVVELVLSAVRPLQLLAGKLLGIGVLALGQVVAMGVVAIVAARAAGTLAVPASAIGTVVVAVIAFAFGFAFFAGLAAGLASTVSRQEEVSGVLAPVTVTLMACYLASFAVADNGGSTLARVLSIVPPISTIAMPARIAQGGVAVLDIVAAVLLLVASTAGIIAVGARIYRASVLHAGSRVPLRRAWRGEPVSDVT